MLHAVGVAMALMLTLAHAGNIIITEKSVLRVQVGPYSLLMKEKPDLGGVTPTSWRRFITYNTLNDQQHPCALRGPRTEKVFEFRSPVMWTLECEDEKYSAKSPEVHEPMVIPDGNLWTPSQLTLSVVRATDCQAEYYFDVADQLCKACPAGETANADQTGCEQKPTTPPVCPESEYAFQGVCKGCPDEEIVNEAKTGCTAKTVSGFSGLALTALGTIAGVCSCLCGGTCWFHCGKWFANARKGHGGDLCIEDGEDSATSQGDMYTSDWYTPTTASVEDVQKPMHWG